MPSFSFEKIFKPIFLCAGALALVSCSVLTTPTNSADRAARAQTDRERLFKNQEPVQGPLTLYDAIARAIKYNSSQKVARMEQSLSEELSQSVTYDMLPSLAASGGFTSHNRKQGFYGEAVKGGSRSTQDAYFIDQNVGTADLQVVFNVLDFGVSYVGAQQASDKKFAAQEAFRKSVQHIVHDVRTAFWRAAAAQRVSKDLDALTKAVEEEVVRLDIPDNADSSLPELKERRDMLAVLKELTALRKQILTAKADLAFLMNLAPNAEFSLEIPPETDLYVAKDLTGLDLEHFALVNRPELRISDYEARILKAEAKKEFLRYFPGLEFSAGVEYDSNSYLYNQSWATAGVRVTWNLMSLFSRPQAIRLAEQKGDLEEARRIAMTMAVISQVRVSTLELMQAAKTYDVAASLDSVNAYVWTKSFKTKNAKERRASLQEAARRLKSRLERDFAFADYKNAESTLLLALGVDPLPRFSVNASVATISNALEDNLSRQAPAPFKDVSYDSLAENKMESTLGVRQRAQIEEWSKKVPQDVVEKPKDAPLAKKKKTAKKKTASAALKQLQISSFAKLTDAQNYYKEISEKFPVLKTRVPVYKEVTVPRHGLRVRTYLTDTELNLQTLCNLLANEIKSCLITNKN